MQDNIFYNNMLNEVSGVNQEFISRQEDDKFNTILKPLVESFSEMGIMGTGSKLIGQGYNIVKNKIFNSVKDIAKQKLKEAGVDEETLNKLDANTPEEFISNAKKLLSDAITKTKQIGTDLYSRAQQEAQTLLEQGSTAQEQLTGQLETAQQEAGNLLGQAQQTTTNILGETQQTGEGLLSQAQDTLQTLRGRLPNPPEITQQDEPSFLSKIMSRFRSKAPPQEGESEGADLQPIEKSPFDIGNTLTGEARQQYLDVLSGRPTTADLLDDDTYETAFKEFEALKRIGVIQTPDTDFTIPKIAMKPSFQTSTSSNIAKAFKDKQDEITQSQQTPEQENITAPQPEPQDIEMTTFKTTTQPIEEGEPTQTIPEDTIAPSTSDTIAPEAEAVSTQQTPLQESITPTTPDASNIQNTPPTETPEADVGEETGANIGKKLGEDVGEDIAETGELDEIPVIGELAILGSAIAGIFEATKKQATPTPLQPSQQFL